MNADRLQMTHTLLNVKSQKHVSVSSIDHPVLNVMLGGKETIKLYFFMHKLLFKNTAMNFLPVVLPA